jgi:hypothetical protein
LLVRRQEITIGVAGAVAIGLNGELVVTVPANYYSSLRSYEVQKKPVIPASARIQKISVLHPIKTAVFVT